LPYIEKDTICAIATPAGKGAIGVIRLSGEKAIDIAAAIFKGKPLAKQKGQRLLFGQIYKDEELLDEVLLSIFRNPSSYTGENLVEISCHGSDYILQQVMELLIEQGARPARPGEFSMRAYLNGKMDLTQTESVADLIASGNKASHQLAMNQMRGGFSAEINQLREELIRFASLMELELDFGEEDVEFADRTELLDLVKHILERINSLIASFKAGQVIKNGIPVAIIGEPNAGKSTLLNALLNEEKAIVSDIPGTTRDSIEDVIQLGGMAFRFIDTAGIRETEDKVEKLGIERTFKTVEKASLVLLLIDSSEVDEQKLQHQLRDLLPKIGQDKQLLLLLNKTDLHTQTLQPQVPEGVSVLSISAREKTGLQALLDQLITAGKELTSADNEVIVSNSRHLHALQKTKEALQRAKTGLEQQSSGDFVAMDIRQALFYLGEIVGTIDMDRDVLGHIFRNFCIGK
jgi:tRNA modification GTPase